MKYNFGMIGLAVMGENLTLNIESRGFSVCGFDINTKGMDNFKTGRASGKNIGFATSLEDLVQKLETPRKIMIMIRAGSPVDSVIEQLIPFLDKGDIIIDGGNSLYTDTMRRSKMVEDKGMLYIGSGVSGGEEGALNGPSLMPGGSKEAWEHIKPIFRKIAAKTDSGETCTAYVGPNGAGHYVKMVHNGIEYGDMQLITEIYHIMKDMLKMNIDEIGDIFAEWNKQELDSYLIEITGHILHYKDSDGSPLVEHILDTAGQKGTGKWTAINSMEEGIPLTLIGESVYARFLSSFKEERVQASKIYNKKQDVFKGDKTVFIEQLKYALLIAKIISYAQGFSLLKTASDKHDWNLNFGEIAMLWRGGCIIRSAFLSKIKDAYDNNQNLSNLLLDPYFKEIIEKYQLQFRNTLSTAILSGIPVPALSSALAYFDGYTTSDLPASLLQAMRDYFGAHTYERKDKKRGEFFHTNWTGHGGNTSSTSYKG